MKVNLPIFFSVILISLLTSSHMIGQKDQIPIDNSLAVNSDRMWIKEGMITAGKPAKLKFGSYRTDNRIGASTKESTDDKTKLFSFELINEADDRAFVEGATNMSIGDGTSDVNPRDDASVYISTSMDKDDLWVLLMVKSNDANEFSVKQLYMTNGDDEITFTTAIGEPTGKSEVTAPKGITARLNGNPIGAMQYYSGGSFSYKKFIWISKTVDKQLQMVTAAVFSSMLELGDYFIDAQFVD